MENLLNATEALVISNENQVQLILEGVKTEAGKGKRSLLFAEEITDKSNNHLSALGYEVSYISDHSCYKITW